MKLQPPKPLAIAISLLSLPLSLQAYAQSHVASPVPSIPATAQGKVAVAASDRKFMDEAAQGGMTEVELGKLAAQKGSTSKVKEFGEQMITDHGKANDRLKELAARKGVTVPTQLPASALREHDKLSKLSGADFDREYMNNMLADHKKDVAEFSTQAKTAHDADVRAFAAATLPTVQHHLEMARDAEAATKSASAAAK